MFFHGYFSFLALFTWYQPKVFNPASFSFLLYFPFISLFFCLAMTHPDVDPTQDPASIFYFHPSDHAGIKLVSTPFDGTGYLDWRRSIIIGLTTKNKMSFIDWTTPKPSSGSVDSKCWEWCNNMVIGWIIASLVRTVAKSIMYYNDAHEIWCDLEERYGKSSYAQL